MNVAAFLKEFKRARRGVGDGGPLRSGEVVGAAGDAATISRRATPPETTSPQDDSGESEHGDGERDDDQAPQPYLGGKRQRYDRFWPRREEVGVGRPRESFAELKTYRTNHFVGTDRGIPDAVRQRVTRPLVSRALTKRGDKPNFNKLRDELLRKKNSLSQSLLARASPEPLSVDASRDAALHTGTEAVLLGIDDLFASDTVTVDPLPFAGMKSVAKASAEGGSEAATATSQNAKEKQQQQQQQQQQHCTDEAKVCSEKATTARVSLFARAKMYSGAAAPLMKKESEVLNARKISNKPASEKVEGINTTRRETFK
ncbi:uncharacterized protein Tco025E_04103 [Trypanosoma conorhini]|uniref:Uncharacterized protein n=1 Tax=Trypanosoma conorhini TaxID=83891 RepID=A0A422PPU7_9TRYP|nr:uncharacterized protein Tco025E_04103 [Trypanosoma conorhini]RNF19766.1 hypothetical protein Tco025E_04103 [Trypanosoma conorhini]